MKNNKPELILGIMTYSDMMALRYAYTCGINTFETRQANSLYVRIVRRGWAKSLRAKHKKEIEELQKQLNAALGVREELNALEEKKRGEDQYQEIRKAVEDRIKNGAKLTKHRIDL